MFLHSFVQEPLGFKHIYLASLNERVRNFVFIIGLYEQQSPNMNGSLMEQQP